MVQQLHNIQRTHLLLTALYHVFFCFVCYHTYFKSSIWQTFVCIWNIIKHIYFHITCIFETSYGSYIIWKEIKQLQPQDQHHQQVKTGNSLVQTSPPPEEPPIEVREQLIQPPFMEQIPSLQDLQQDSQVFDTEHLLNLHTPNISIERTYSHRSFPMTEPSLSLLMERKDV